MNYSYLEDADLLESDILERVPGKKKDNPYSAAPKKNNKRDLRNLQVRKLFSKRTPPEQKGYLWQIGYNNLVGRYTQGDLFPEMSGSSLNRKTKNGKDIPAEDRYIIEMADKAAEQYARCRGDQFVTWNGKREYFCWLPEIVRHLLIQGDRESAFKLALWISESLRKLLRRLSFGIHMLSARSRGKIKDKATAFYRASPGNRVFATLTFIDRVDDRTAILILNSFLTQVRKKFPGLQYFWIAERQDGKRNEERGVQKDPTGNIHFHMILNKRLPVGRWNALWAVAQYNAGLIGHDRYGNEITKAELLEAFRWDHAEGYKKKRVQQMLNPFDIKKINSIGRLSNYLTKYITKQDADASFGCSAWHCSRGVSRMFTKQTVGPSAFAYMKSLANFGMDRTTGEVWAVPQEYRTGNGFVVCVYACNKAAPLKYLKRMEQVNKWILEGVEIDQVPMVTADQYKRNFIAIRKEEILLLNDVHPMNEWLSGSVLKTIMADPEKWMGSYLNSML